MSWSTFSDGMTVMFDSDVAMLSVMVEVILTRFVAVTPDVDGLVAVSASGLLFLSVSLKSRTFSSDEWHLFTFPRACSFLWDTFCLMLIVFSSHTCRHCQKILTSSHYFLYDFQMRFFMLYAHSVRACQDESFDTSFVLLRHTVRVLRAVIVGRLTAFVPSTVQHTPPPPPHAPLPVTRALLRETFIRYLYNISSLIAMS